MRVIAYVPDEVVTLAVGLASAVFKPRPSLHALAIEWVTPEPGPVRTDSGLSIEVPAGLGALAEVQSGDLVLVLPGAVPVQTADEVRESLVSADAAGATIAAHCAGVFTVADTGLLDGRRATTHWEYADSLRRRRPAVDVTPDALYVDEGQLLTGAGAAAGGDLYLHLVRRELGAAVANALARTMVVAPHRSGDQAQFLQSPVPSADGAGHLEEVMAWASASLHLSPSIDDLAGRAAMSRRSFIRSFHATTGTTPHQWLIHQRVVRAQELLETTHDTIEAIAHTVGFSSAAVLRERFVDRLGVTPRDYRRTFDRTT